MTALDCVFCVSGRHRNCDNTTWDLDDNTLIACPCDQRAHGAPVVNPNRNDGGEV